MKLIISTLIVIMICVTVGLQAPQSDPLPLPTPMPKPAEVGDICTIIDMPVTVLYRHLIAKDLVMIQLPSMKTRTVNRFILDNCKPEVKA